MEGELWPGCALKLPITNPLIKLEGLRFRADTHLLRQVTRQGFILIQSCSALPGQSQQAHQLAAVFFIPGLERNQAIGVSTRLIKTPRSTQTPAPDAIRQTKPYGGVPPLPTRTTLQMPGCLSKRIPEEGAAVERNGRFEVCDLGLRKIGEGWLFTRN